MINFKTHLFILLLLLVSIHDAQFDQPTEVTEKPTEVTEKLTEVTEKPTEVTEKLTEVTEKPTDITGEPTEVTEKPTDITEEPTEVTEKPTEFTDKPTEFTDKPTDITEEPTDIIEEPTEVTEKPTDITKELQVCKDEITKLCNENDGIVKCFGYILYYMMHNISNPPSYSGNYLGYLFKVANFAETQTVNSYCEETFIKSSNISCENMMKMFTEFKNTLYFSNEEDENSLQRKKEDLTTAIKIFTDDSPYDEEIYESMKLMMDNYIEDTLQKLKFNEETLKITEWCQKEVVSDPQKS